MARLLNKLNSDYLPIKTENGSYCMTGESDNLGIDKITPLEGFKYLEIWRRLK